SAGMTDDRCRGRTACRPTRSGIYSLTAPRSRARYAPFSIPVPGRTRGPRAPPPVRPARTPPREACIPEPCTMPFSWSDEVIEAVRHRYENELTVPVASIADEVGMNEKTVYRLASHFGWRKRSAPRELPQ